MASFDTLARWERYVPALGDNQQRDKPFYLRLAAGLTIEEFRALQERLTTMEPTPAGMERALAGLVEFGPEPLDVGGRRIETLGEYLALIARQRGGELVMELTATLTRLNSTEGAQELFSARLSGGASTTRPAPRAADTRSGSSTSPSPRPPTTAAQASAAGGSTIAAPSTPASEGAST